MDLEFKLFKYYISKKTKIQLLLGESNGNKVSSRPIVESTVGSREDPIVQVTFTVNVFYIIDSMVANAYGAPPVRARRTDF